MAKRAGIYAAVAGTVLLFLCIQLGALALVEPFEATGQQAVENPEDPTNTLVFFGFILVATAVMLGLIKFGRERYIRLFVVVSSGGLAWYVSSVLFTRFLPSDPSTAVAAVGVLVPLSAFLAIVVGLLVHPEWYVIDGAGVIMGAGAAGLFGVSFSPFPAIVFLSILAVYDAISVYGTEHMLTLADGVMDLNVPVLLVIPTTLSYSFRADTGPETLENEGVDGELETDSGDNVPDDDSTDDADAAAPAPGNRDALFIGLGDAVMPTILVASAVTFHPEVAPIDLPGIALTVPALGALIGTLLGLLALLYLVLAGRAHAGLPLLNGGSILGYLVGAMLSGLSLVEAIGLPL